MRFVHVECLNEPLTLTLTLALSLALTLPLTLALTRTRTLTLALTRSRPLPRVGSTCDRVPSRRASPCATMCGRTCTIATLTVTDGP